MTGQVHLGSYYKLLKWVSNTLNFAFQSLFELNSELNDGSVALEMLALILVWLGFSLPLWHPVSLNQSCSL